MRRLALSLLLLAACGDDEADDSPSLDAGSDAGVDAGTPVCELGATASASIGAAGGTLELCGAYLRVAPGELDAPVAFTIEQVASPPAPAEPRVLAGPAFHFGPDDVQIPGMVEVHVPHGGATGRLEMAAVTDRGELFGFEACDLDDETIWQFFGSAGDFPLGPLGTFVALHDTYAYADARQELGSGTVEAMLGDRALVFDVDSDGFAFDEFYPPGVSLTVEVEVPEVPDLEQLRVQLFVPEQGPAEVIYIQWYSASKLWGFGPDGTTAVADISLETDGRVTGTVSGLLASGDETLAYAIELDVLAEYWRFPAERVCPGQGE